MSTTTTRTQSSPTSGASSYGWTAGTGAAPRRRRSGRVRALLAGGMVLGVGSVATLAAWTDTEFVFGNGASGPGRTGVAASVFEIQQNVWDGTSGAANFVDRETQDIAGGLVFSPLQATSLSPGNAVYAPMQLRTAARSAGADVTINAASLQAGDATFFGSLVYSVRRDVARADCAAAAFAGPTQSGTQLVTSAPLATASAPAAVRLAPATATDPGAPVDLCFAIALPGDAPNSLQGLGATPVWSFTGQSFA